MKLFSAGKVGFLLDSITHKTEKRRDGEVKVIVLGCRVVPFDHTLAQSLDDSVRGSLFKRSGNAEPHGHVAGMDFTLPIERQDVDIYATPDTLRAGRRLTQVKVSHLRAQIEKGSNAYALKVKLTFGPADEKELAMVEGWRQTQKFLTFAESAPDLAFEEIGATDDEAEEDDEAQPELDGVEPARRLPKRKTTNGSGATA